MANPLQILVDDTSPSITYYPWADTLGAPNVLAGWNPYYTGSSFAAYQGEVGKGTSLHLTSLNGASFSIQWQGMDQTRSNLTFSRCCLLLGTGIQLYGNATQASYDLTLNGTPTLANSSSLPDSLLAEFHDLPDANYTLTLSVQSASPPTSDSFVAFDKALITSFSDVSAYAGVLFVNLDMLMYFHFALAPLSPHKLSTILTSPFWANGLSNRLLSIRGLTDLFTKPTKPVIALR